MGSRGPKPQTAEQLKLRGSKRAKGRARAEAAETPLPAGSPARPSFCPAPLAGLFDELCRTLHGLTPSDGPLLVALASAHDDLRKADAAVRRKGLAYQNSRGDQSKRPEVALRSEARQAIIEIHKQLDRRSAVAPAPDDDTDPDFDA